MSRFTLLLLCMLAAGSSSYASSCGQPDATVQKSIVKVISDRSNGSGVVISRGLVLTASHVLDDIDDIKIAIGQRTRPAHLLSRDSSIDLALLSVDTGEIKPLQIRRTPLRRTEPVWALGYALGKQLKSGAGAFRTETNGLLYTSAPVNFGQSGGGMLSCENGHHVLAGIIRAFGAKKKGDRLVRRDDISVATRTEDTRFFIETAGKMASLK